MSNFDPDALEREKDAVNVSLPRNMLSWIEERAAIETEGNRSMALTRMLRKLARYEQAEQDGRLSIKKQS